MNKILDYILCDWGALNGHPRLKKCSIAANQRIFLQSYTLCLCYTFVISRDYQNMLYKLCN